MSRRDRENITWVLAAQKPVSEKWLAQVKQHARANRNSRSALPIRLIASMECCQIRDHEIEV
jgi:hypothetical protein